MAIKVNGSAVPPNLKFIGVGLREIPKAKLEGEDEIFNLVQVQIQFAPHVSSVIQTRPQGQMGCGVQTFLKKAHDGPKAVADKLRVLADHLDQIADGQAPKGESPEGDRVSDNDEDSPCPQAPASPAASTH